MALLNVYLLTMSQLKHFFITRLFIAFLVSIVAYPHTFSQDLEKEFNDFQQEIDDDFNQSLKDQENEFKAFILEKNKEFYSFLLEADKEFSDFLRQEWIEVNSFSYEDYDKSKKPKFEKEYSQVDFETKIYSPNSKVEISPMINECLNNTNALQNEKKNAVFKQFDFEFYGAKIALSYDPEILSGNYSDIDNNVIADFWESTSKTNYSRTIRELYEIKENLNLNDWAFFKLVDNLFEELVSGDNMKQLCKWFFLNKAGYEVKLGTDDKSLYLILASKNAIYSMPYFEMNNTKYLIVNGKPDRIKTYPSSTKFGKSFSLYQFTPLNLPLKPGHKKINFPFYSIDYSFKIPFNKNNFFIRI